MPIDAEAPPMVTNEIEIRVCGLMRSGNHAIIQWLQNQFRGKVTCFLNNVDHGDHDPFVANRARVLTGVSTNIDTETLRSLEKALLLYSYEDRQSLEETGLDFVSSVFDPRFEARREQYLGSSRTKFDVFIVRDPFNCFASRLEMLRERGPQGGTRDMNVIASNWKIMARTAIDVLAADDPRRLVVSYNRWAVDATYRAELSKMLMGSFDDSSMRETPTFGGGSSFYLEPVTATTFVRKWRLLFDPRTLRRLPEFWMRVRGPKREDYSARWKMYRFDEEYRTLFQDKEIAELSERLFGKIPGTRRFVSRL